MMMNSGVGRMLISIFGDHRIFDTLRPGGVRARPHNSCHAPFEKSEQPHRFGLLYRRNLPQLVQYSL